MPGIDSVDRVLSSMGKAHTDLYLKNVEALRRMSPGEIEKIAKIADNMLRSLPPAKREITTKIVQATLETDPRSPAGIGFLETLGKIATIAATVGSLGLSVYGVIQAKKDSDKARDSENRAAKLAQDRLKAEIAAQQQQATEQLKIAEKQVIQQEKIAAVTQEKAVESKKSLNKTLLISGGVVAAALLMFFVLRKPSRNTIPQAVTQ